MALSTDWQHFSRHDNRIIAGGTRELPQYTIDKDLLTPHQVLINSNTAIKGYSDCISREALCAELLGALVRPYGVRRATPFLAP
jgi:hypothetical protein